MGQTSSRTNILQPHLTGKQEWDLNTGFIQRSYANHTGQISSIRFRPNSATIPIYPAASPPKPVPMPSLYDNRRRGSLGSNNSLESLFGDESPTNGTMNEALLDPVIDNDDPETITTDEIPIPSSEKESCRDVFLTSSIDGAISLWDRRQERMVARLAGPSRGSPPWCMSVFSLLFFKVISDEINRHVGLRMEISFMLGDEMLVWMNIQYINHLIHLHGPFDFQQIQDQSLLSLQCQTARI